MPVLAVSRGQLSVGSHQPLTNAPHCRLLFPNPEMHSTSNANLTTRPAVSRDVPAVEFLACCMPVQCFEPPGFLQPPTWLSPMGQAPGQDTRPAGTAIVGTQAAACCDEVCAVLLLQYTLFL